jgi:hypothetical protein
MRTLLASRLLILEANRASRIEQLKAASQSFAILVCLICRAQQPAYVADLAVQASTLFYASGRPEH